jgi:predicted Zn finger-like uncharacterized protein
MPLLQTLFQPSLKVKSTKADAEGRRFHVKAVGGGFFARLFGFGTDSSLTVNEDGFRLEKTTFGMEETVYIPRSKIASTLCVVSKPVILLVIGILMLLGGGGSLLAIALSNARVSHIPSFLLIGVGLIFLVIYFLSRRGVIIGVVSTGGTVESMKLKASDAQLETIREGMDLLELLIREGSESPPSDSEPAGPRSPWSSGSRAAKAAPAAAPAPAAESGGMRTIACPSCGTRMSVPAAAAGKKVRCVSCREVFPVPTAGE